MVSIQTIPQSHCKKIVRSVALALFTPINLGKGLNKTIFIHILWIRGGRRSADVRDFFRRKKEEEKTIIQGALEEIRGPTRGKVGIKRGFEGTFVFSLAMRYFIFRLTSPFHIGVVPWAKYLVSVEIPKILFHII